MKIAFYDAPWIQIYKQCNEVNRATNTSKLKYMFSFFSESVVANPIYAVTCDWSVSLGGIPTIEFILDEYST